MKTRRPKRAKTRAVSRDERRQLFNQGRSGVVGQIQVSRERISQQLGFMFDIDPPILRHNPFFRVDRDPTAFYRKTLRPMLDREEVLRRAKVIASGAGLQVVLAFDKPEPCDTDAARDRVEAILEAVLPVLPIDPDQPGITATRRKVGSINSKNGKKVTLLAKGEPIPFVEIESLANRMVQAPFRTVMQVLTGQELLTPCPICGGKNTKLKVLDHRGVCYGSCGNVNLEAIWEAIYKPRPVELRKEKKDV